MARKFLYLVAGLIVLFLAALFALRIAGDSLAEIAFVPSGDFVEQEPLAEGEGLWLDGRLIFRGLHGEAEEERRRSSERRHGGRRRGNDPGHWRVMSPRFPRGS